MRAISPESGTPVRGITYMVASLLLLSIGDAVTKWLGASLPVGQIVCLRALFIFAPIFIIVCRSGGLESLKVVDRRGMAMRAAYFIATTSLITISMIVLPLADASALLFAGPLFVAALATRMLGEHIGWRLWAAILVGFAGVIVMLRPTPDAIQPLAILPIVAALFSALRDITTRRISATETNNAIMFWSTLALLLGSAATIPFGWNPISWMDFGLLSLSGFVVGFAHYFMIESYRVAEASVVSPFKYSGIVWAVLFGYVIWGAVPDLYILSGGALVVASGLYILHRETRRLR